MMQVRFTFLFSYCLIAALSVWDGRKIFAQNTITYEQFTSENGLSENVVYCVYQDKKGFIWAGTDYGLNRFDGYVFTQYHQNRGDSSTLSNNSIMYIQEDEIGSFWIGTNQGLNYFDPYSGKSERMHMPVAGLNYAVHDIYDLGNGQLFLSTGDSIAYLFDIECRVFTSIPFPYNSVVISNDLIRLQGHQTGFLVYRIGFGYGFAVFNQDHSRLDFEKAAEVLPFSKANALDYYFRDSSGNHYVYSEKGYSFVVYDAEGQKVASADEALLKQFTAIRIYCMTEVGDRQIWIGTNQGLIIYDRISKQIWSPELVGDSKSLPGKKEIRAILNDQKSNVWLGVFGEGLFHCDNRKNPFKHLTLSEITRNETSRMIMGLFPWQNNWVAAETAYGNYTLINEGQVMGIISRQEISLEQTLWMHGIASYDQLSSFHKKYMDSLLHTPSNLFPNIFYLPNDTSVIQYLNGLTLHMPTSIKRYKAEYANHVIEDELYYWVASANGLHRIHKKDFSDTTYTFEPGNPYSLSEPALHYVVMDDNQDLWIATKGGGLNQFDKALNRFYHYTVEDGLLDNVIYFILPDDKGNLWLTTNKGISKFNIREKTFSNYTRRDGLLNTEFNRMGGFRTEDGIMYLSGTSGIDYFRPDEVVAIRKVEAIYITGWKINEIEWLPSASRTFRYNQNNLVVHFTTNDFIRPELIYFRYRLQPDQAWTKTQGSNAASFSGLGPDQYHFEVQASYDNLYWSQSAGQLFAIRTPWWTSWWFLTLCAAFITGGLYFFYRYRIEQLKRLQRIRTKISRDLHDEVGSTLSSIHVYSSVAAKAMEINPEATKDALQQIKKNSREVMENMSDIVWAINTGNNGQMSLEDKLKNYGYELLTPLGINCLYDIDRNAEKKLVNIEARKNVLLIVKEAMNNIAKYSAATEASFQLGIANGYLRLKIVDNGRGFNPDIRRHGNGLFNMQQRTESLGGKFNLESAEAQGTILRCEIPLPSISDMWTGEHP